MIRIFNPIVIHYIAIQLVITEHYLIYPIAILQIHLFGQGI
jgi:hypothetical protein